MKVIVFGSEGAMGSNLRTALGDTGIDFIAVDPKHEAPGVVNNLNDVQEGDVIIDFSHHSHAKALSEYAVRTNRPLVVATTGHTEDEHQEFIAASKHIPIFKSANMSFGVNLLSRILRDYASLIEDDYDIEIIEAHHRNKIDAPSGTAYLLADAIQEGTSGEKAFVLDRNQRRQKRSRDQIGLSSVRGGSIAGEHTVLFAGESDTLSITHKAQSKTLFSEGAIRAARYIIHQTPGFYTMDDLIQESRKS